METSKLSKLMTTAGAVYDKKITHELVKIYADTTADLTDDEITTAFGRAARELKWFPKPAELRELAGHGPELVKDKAEKAWALVIDAMRRYGGNSSVNFGPVINAVIDQMGGWIYLCEQDMDSLHNFRAREFKQAFASYSVGRVTAPAHLAGRFELENRTAGFDKHIPLPICLDPKVLTGGKKRPELEGR